ncbi:MAG: TIGR00269 family protein [Nitrososphaeria archaeon]
MSVQKACSRCGKPAFYFKPYSGEYLCKKCFVKSIYESTLRAIRKYKMIEYHDRIGIAVSGGKDSISLLYIIAKFFRDNEIVAITLDEGIEGYRNEAITIANDMAAKLNIKHVTYRYKDMFSYTIDDVQPIRRETSSCTICGIFRRRGLDMVTKELGLDVLLTAHNLDDLLQSYFIMLFNGDINKMMMFSPAVEASEAFGIKKAHPLMYIYEKEMSMFTYLKGFKMQTVTCPYMNQGIRSEIREYLNKMEEEHPGIKYQLLNSFLKLKDVKNNNSGGFCKNCGWPSKGNICQVCKTVEMLNANKLKV